MNSQATRDGSPMRILVTGAAGLIGGELCARLTERGHGVVALVHRARSIVRNSGQTMCMTPFGGDGPNSGQLVWLAGDVKKPGLGIGAAQARTLAASVDLIVHCAAIVGFTATAAEHRAVNVEGTANVLAFAQNAAGAAPGIVYLSTAYVCGERSGVVEEAGCGVSQTFANAYEATKAQAEALVAASGARAAVARPSIVVGASDTGAIGRFENLYGLIKLIGSGHIRTLPAAPGATLDLVPIDHVVGGLVDIVERFDAAAGRHFHLASGDPVSVWALGAPISPGFHVPRLVSPARFDPSALGAGERSLYRNCTSLYVSYLRRDLRFSTENLRILSGRVCPAAGLGLLRRIIEYAVAAGYLRPTMDLLSA